MEDFDPFSEDYFDRPLVAYEWLREHEPVHLSDTCGFCALSRYDDIQAAFRDPGAFSSRFGVMLTNMATPGFDAHRDLPGLFSQYDPPLHKRSGRRSTRCFVVRGSTRSRTRPSGSWTCG